MSSIAPTSGGHAVQPPHHPQQSQSLDNQTPHTGQPQHSGTTHPSSSSLGSLPQSGHIGSHVGTHVDTTA